METTISTLSILPSTKDEIQDLLNGNSADDFDNIIMRMMFEIDNTEIAVANIGSLVKRDGYNGLFEGGHEYNFGKINFGEIVKMFSV